MMVTAFLVMVVLSVVRSSQGTIVGRRDLLAKDAQNVPPMKLRLARGRQTQFVQFVEMEFTKLGKNVTRAQRANKRDVVPIARKRKDIGVLMITSSPLTASPLEPYFKLEAKLSLAFRMYFRNYIRI